jgi:membrane-associated phospholipid phosphatase
LCLSLAGARSAAAQDGFHHLFPLPAQTAADARSDVPDVTDGALVPARALLQAIPQAPPPSQPEHTGFSALVHSTASDFNAFPRRKSTWVILGGGAVAALIAHPFDDDVQESWGDSSGAKNFFKLGRYLGSVYVQTGVAVGLYAIGRYALPPDPGTSHTNKWSHLGFDLVRSTILSQAFVLGIKYAAQRDRPTGECCAFPSGHAATTFATASVLERHFGYRGAWPTLLAASYVGMSRLADNRHFLSDVVFGAALGIATGWTVVGRHGRENFTLLPVPVRGGIEITFARLDPEERRRGN